MSDSVSPTRYEAASTIYGPHTLLAYQQQYARIVKVTSLTILDSKQICLRHYLTVKTWIEALRLQIFQASK